MHSSHSSLFRLLSMLLLSGFMLPIHAQEPAVPSAPDPWDVNSGWNSALVFSPASAVSSMEEASLFLHYDSVHTVTLYCFHDSLSTYGTIRLLMHDNMSGCEVTFSLMDFRVLPPDGIPVRGRITPAALATPQQPYVTLTKVGSTLGDSLFLRPIPLYVEDHDEGYALLPLSDSTATHLYLSHGEYVLDYLDLLTDSGACALPTQLTLAIEIGSRPEVSNDYVLPFTGENRITEFTCWNAEGTEGQTKTVVFDDFGREQRTVLEGFTPMGHDLVSLTEYDGFGRRTHTWLPAPIPHGTPPDAYGIKAAAAGCWQGDAAPFSLIQYEPNPLSRVSQVTGPGAAWHTGGRSVRMERMTNRTDVDSLRCRMLHAEDSGDTLVNVRCTGDYAGGTLYVERTSDEDGRTLLTFTDKQGRKVLTRRMTGNTGCSSTYYVYDGLGRLRAVLPAALEHELLTGSTLSTEGRDNYAFLYQYDAYGNVIAKKLPGCAWTTFACDGGSRPVLSQDGRQRQKGEMTYILYDPAGREAVKGICQGSPETHRNTLYGLYALCPFTRDIRGTFLGYTPDAALAGMLTAPLSLSANYYDSYAFNDSTGFALPALGIYEGDMMLMKGIIGNGMVTGTAVRTGETAQDSVRYGMTVYSSRTMLPVYAVAQNSLGGTDITQTTYDYAGRPSQVLMSHMADTQMSTVEAQISVNYSYDNGGRIATVTQTLNDGTPLVIAHNEYDELGRLARRHRGDNALLDTEYAYNIRDWTTAITSQPFSQSLHYNTAHNGSTPQWAGNISAMDWKSGYGNDNGNVLPLEGYTFAYDGMSRLTQADYHTDGNRSTHYDTRYTYDSMGNMLTLKRSGMMEKADTTAHTSAAYALIDDLTFAYDGNQIIKVTDAVDDGPYYQGAWHYRDNADKQQERFYDGNGNLTKDLDAKISDIQYNSLNLPIMITFTDGSTTRYTYDAAGRKLRTEHRVMTTGVFNPGQELLDDAGVLDEPGVEMPAPDFPGLNGPAAVMMPQEMEQAAPPAISAAEEASGSPKRPRSTGDAPAEYLPYELTVTDYCGNFIYENGKLNRILFDGGFITFPDSVIPHPEMAGATCVIADITRPQYHYCFTDHLGSVRVVTDAQGNIEQTNNYYPYGGLMASSSTIANPVSQANVGANQPNRYNGKELDRKNGLDWLDYGARHFAGHGQWTSPDPLAEKYYDSTPFGYCRNNPINKIDPDGRDEWEINKKGYIVNHIKTNEHDAFFVVNRKGKRIQDKSITFRFGTIEKATGHKDAKGYSYDLYQVRGDSNGTSLFEFVAKNTDVEWSQIKTGIKGNKGLNFLTTSHEHASERGSTDLYDKQLRHGYTIREDIHSHPENTPYPSGLKKKKGDISNAAYVVQRTGQQPQFKIYIPGENRYIQYNQDSLEKDFVLEFRYSIDEVIVNGTRR